MPGTKFFHSPGTHFRNHLKAETKTPGQRWEPLGGTRVEPVELVQGGTTPSLFIGTVVPRTDPSPLQND